MKSSSEPSPAGLPDEAADNDHHPDRSRRSAFPGQIPAIILTAALVIGAMAWMRDQDALRRTAELAPLRTQNEDLRTQAEENRRQIEATAKLLRDALTRHDGEVFRTDEEIQKLNADRVAMLADAVAQKVAPALPPVKSPAELEQLQSEQMDKIATRLTDNLRPLLATMSSEQKAGTTQIVRRYEERVQQLNRELQASQAAAQDALKLSHEVSALYLDSYKDKGMLVRLMALPANLLIDAAHLDLVTSRDRAKVDADLAAKMNDIDQRLRSIQATTVAANKD
jgi:hypothetical protein